MHMLRPLLLSCAALAAASVFAQEIPPPPRTPATPPPNPSTVNEPKVSAPTSARHPAPEPGRVVKSAAKSTPMPVATPLPIATPKPNFWQRLFSPRKTRMVPVDKSGKPEAEPAPKAKSKAKRTTEKPDKTAKPKTRTEPDEKPKPEPEKPRATPEPRPRTTPAPKPATAATPKPKPAATTPKATPAPAPAADADVETVERYKFTEAKRKALEDPAIQDLKLKADTAPSETEARKALRSYNKALFQKMKKIDPSIGDRIDATEAAILKRLGGE